MNQTVEELDKNWERWENAYKESCAKMEICDLEFKPIVSNTIMTKYVVGFSDIQDLEKKLPQVKSLMAVMEFYVRTVEKELKNHRISYDRNGINFTINEGKSGRVIPEEQEHYYLQKGWKQAIERLMSEVNLDINPYSPVPISIELKANENSGL